MARFRIETRRVRFAQGPDRPRHRTHSVGFATATVTGTGALVALATSQTFGNVHAHSLDQRLVALLGALSFLVLALIAVQNVSSTLSALVALRAGSSGGTVVRVVTRFVGYVIVLFLGLGLLDIPVQHLILGGALTGVIVGIAAQQALGNVFAGLVLLMARTFSVDDRVRVRAGSLGGGLEGVVRGIGLVYVTIETSEGPVNIPNSTLLAAGVGPAPSERGGDLAVALSGAPPVEPPNGAEGRRPKSPLFRAAREIERIRSR